MSAFLERKPQAPARSALISTSRSWGTENMTILTDGALAVISRQAPMPSSAGIPTSISTSSGR